MIWLIINTILTTILHRCLNNTIGDHLLFVVINSHLMSFWTGTKIINMNSWTLLRSYHDRNVIYCIDVYKGTVHISTKVIFSGLFFKLIWIWIKVHGLLFKVHPPYNGFKYSNIFRDLHKIVVFMSAINVCYQVLSDILSLWHHNYFEMLFVPDINAAMA